MDGHVIVDVYFLSMLWS